MKITIGKAVFDVFKVELVVNSERLKLHISREGAGIDHLYMDLEQALDPKAIAKALKAELSSKLTERKTKHESELKVINKHISDLGL